MSAEFRTLQQLACIDRGEHGERRIELTECTSDRGEANQFVNVRLWFKGDDGQMHAGKQGLTIRKTEIHDFGKALRAALDAMNEGRAPRQPAAGFEKRLQASGARPTPTPRRPRAEDASSEEYSGCF